MDVLQPGARAVGQNICPSRLHAAKRLTIVCTRLSGIHSVDPRPTLYRIGLMLKWLHAVCYHSCRYMVAFMSASELAVEYITHHPGC